MNLSRSTNPYLNPSFCLKMDVPDPFAPYVALDKLQVQLSRAQQLAGEGKLAQVAYQSRHLVEHMALVIQSACLLRYGDSAIASAYCRARLNPEINGLMFGTLPEGIDCATIIARATPSA